MISQARPAAPHLTSVQAEQLLARACENEAENAKRMRMGIEPVSQPMPSAFTTTAPVDVLAAAAAAAAAAQQQQQAAAVAAAAGAGGLSVFPSVVGEKQLKAEYKSEQLASLLAAAQQDGKVSSASSPTVVGVGGAGAALSTVTSVVPATLAAAFPGAAVVNGSNGSSVATTLPAGVVATNMYRTASGFQAVNAFPSGTATLLQHGGQAMQQPTTVTIQNG